ncbi:MAG: 2-amino-4-hydroxy-6-hydroxymethyldihydropteridine diphosphokinase [Cycloclasticus sp.]|nr:2-amino-4-hydroxy-6-hydroxymethyldihydropteridine diphosphokinase [Cycloclasticus sp.]
MTTVFISIGSNIEPDKHIRAGVNALASQFGKLRLSSVYQADAIGFIGAPFLNLIAAFDTQLSATEVDAILDNIEQDNGRTSQQKKFNPRTLDLDLVLYGNYISNDPQLEIPRKEITRYAFVLEPLAEIAASLLHPIVKQPYAELWLHFDKTDLVQKRIDFAWD